MSESSDIWGLAGKIAFGVGATALAAAGTIAVAKSGAVQSAVARWKRKLDEGRLIDSPKAGTPLLVSLARGGAEHSGVFLGRSRVAELTGNGLIQDVSLSEFVNGDENDLTNLRTGTRIFAACDDSSGQPLTLPRIAKSAREFIEKVGRVPYNLFCNNCHLFTASCIQGEMNEKLSFCDWLKDGTFSIDCLDEVVSRIMNAGKPVAWIGVREPTRFFSYVLTEEKIARLRSEGRCTAASS